MLHENHVMSGAFIHAVVGRAHWRPGCSAHPGTPCGRVANPAPASVGVADLAWAVNGVSHYMSAVTFFTVCNTEDALFFYPMRLPSLDCGRLFSAKIAFRDKLCATLQGGRFCGTFSAAPARFFTSAQVFAPSRPAKGSAPFDPRQGRSPCTCPAPPFLAKPGLCFTYPACNRKNKHDIILVAKAVWKLKRQTLP